MYKSAARFRCHSGRIDLGKTPSGSSTGPCNADSHKKKKNTSKINNAGKQIRLSTLKPGNKLHGVVANILDYGAFIDLGGIFGLLHISEISEQRIDDLRSLLKIGQKIEPTIKEIEKDKYGKYKISLTLLEKSKTKISKEVQNCEKLARNNKLPPAKFNGFGTIGDLLFIAMNKGN